ncbi:hypothetical protein [Phyllobacterium endophyticum]|uniref:hypothetical protein n=1 Tax=Phyllobacterium endophyticum TaxID=1149773 RepID=UPI0011CC0D86|nr:hypothetical protein [Phyllobacterium endophyticum]TXR46611.1 hypothetical protein FVA77_24120 [Phyllobacterium endophyticum]
MSWLAEAFVDLWQRIQNRWTDYFHGDPHEGKVKPYLRDELLSPSSWLAFGLYAVIMFLTFWLLSPPEWLVLLLLIGFAVLGRALFKDIWFTSSWTKPKKPDDADV